MRTLPVAFALLAGLSLAATAADPKPYAVPVSLQVDQVEPVLTVGEKSRGYALEGALAGLATAPGDRGKFRLLVAHAFAPGQGPGGVPVSSWDVKAYTDEQGLLPVVTSGGDAARKVVEATDGKKAPPAYLHAVCAAGAPEGFDRPVLLAGEEGGGGRAWALADGRAYPLPAMGSFPKGGLAVLDGTGDATVLVLTEASPTGGPDSRVFVYVGKKSGGDEVLARNGLSGGALFAVAVKGQPTESGLKKGQSYRFDLAPVTPGAGAAAGTGFVLLGGVCQDPSRPKTVYLAAVGSEARGRDGRLLDHNGRLYALTFDDPSRPQAGGTLEVALSGVEGVIGPSALAMDSRGRLVVGEAPTFPTPGRDTSLWLFEPRTGALTRLLEVNPGATGRGSEPGSWTIGGVADASAVMGSGAWLVTIRTGEPLRDAKLVEDGQVVAVHLR